MVARKYLPRAILARAVTLDPLGIDGLTWNKSDALKVLKVLACLEGGSVAVLGGDVYRITSEAIEPAYENWFCERKSKEEFRCYAKRSQLEAKAYLDAYPEDDKTLFYLQLSSEETAGMQRVSRIDSTRSRTPTVRLLGEVIATDISIQIAFVHASDLDGGAKILT